jgi:hypothetical protein
MLAGTGWPGAITPNVLDQWFNTYAAASVASR